MKTFLLASLLAFHSSTALAKDSELPPAQAEVVAAERAFARVAGELGFQQSFIAFFAEDGISFGPHPFKMKETLIRQPPSNAPMGLTWAPVFGDIAQAGDLGWNTGPTLFDATADGKPKRHGMFFSVWKKQEDGSWRVVLDLGSETPAAVVPLDARFQTSYRASDKPPAENVNVEKEIAALLVVEREFLAAANANLGQAYLGRIGDQARVHRPGAMPLVGKEALHGWLAKQTTPLRGEPLKADVSSSADLGYAYGSYEIDGAAPEAGYYARVWKRDAKGQWRIVMDTISPLPAGIRPLTARLQQAEEYYLSQRWADAAAAYQKYVDENPDNAFAWHRLGSSQIGQRQLPEAIQNLEQAIKVGGGTALDFYNLACAYALSGQADKALDNVERAITAGFTNGQQFETDSDLASIRETERFKELMKRLG